MKIGIVGLGIIGGSFAKAFKKYTPYTVCGMDIDKAVLHEAKKAGAIDCTDEISTCDVVFVCMYPRACMRYINETIFKRNAVVTDICGIKRALVITNKDIRYVGSHPMAGKETSGFASSDARLFCGASYIITHDAHTDSQAMQILEELATKIGFTQITKCDAIKHDRIIAYTSQLAHVVSNSYVKGKEHHEFQGFSAGSFADLTRVAQLNAEMWAELFIENGDFLVQEIDELMLHMTQIREAIAKKDEQTLRRLLQEGSDIKQKLEQRNKK
ncbi:MAG: prephenate dehydrogenase/arogenate dehydrogenase family protein [Christensenellaceae bacterium]